MTQRLACSGNADGRFVDFSGLTCRALRTTPGHEVWVIFIGRLLIYLDSHFATVLLKKQNSCGVRPTLSACFALI